MSGVHILVCLIKPNQDFIHTILITEGKNTINCFSQKVSRADNIAKSMASEGNRVLLSVNVDHAVNSSLEFRCSTLSFSVNKINCYLGTLNIALY